MDRKKFGQHLKEARHSLGYTQDQVAELVNISVIYLSELERGVKLPSFALFVSLTEVLSVSADSLLRDTVDTPNATAHFIYTDLTQKLDALTPKQRVCAIELLETYIRNQ